MRVLQVTATYYPELHFGGPPQKIHDLSRGLVRLGHEVEVITMNSTQPRSDQCLVVDGVNIRYLPWVGSGVRRLPLGRDRLAAAVHKADIVHVYGLYNLLGPAAARIARRLGRPLILEPIGMYTPRTRRVLLKRLYHRLFTVWMTRDASRVIATSQTEWSELAEVVETSKLFLRRNGVDLALFQDLPPRSVFRERYDIADDERLALYVGRLSPIKNLEQLLMAFHRAALSRARLVLVGPALEPDYANRLRVLIDKLALADRVHLVGPLFGRDKLTALAAADLFVLPSLYESYGIAAAEAIAAGVPVLITDTCGLAPQVHGRAGLAVPLGVSSLAEGLCTMLDDPAKRMDLTQRQAEVLQGLSWEEPLRQTELLYGSLVTRL